MGNDSRQSEIDDFKRELDEYQKTEMENRTDAERHEDQGMSYMMSNPPELKSAADEFLAADTNTLVVICISRAIGVEKRGKEIVRHMLKEDEFFKEATKDIEGNELKAYQDIYIQSLKIISKLEVTDKDEKHVAHYTRKAVSECMLFENSPFRLSSVNTCNDPEEGKTLFRYLFKDKEYPTQVEEYGAFAGCFIFCNDSLNQFRLYGKENDVEGTGVSITFKSNFFSDEISGSVNTAPKVKEIESNTEKETKDTPQTFPLFRCIYIDPETGLVVSIGQKEKHDFYREGGKGEYNDYQIYMNDTLKKVNGELETLKKQAAKLDATIVNRLLLNLRYLVKHVAFKEEQECRIIHIRKLTKGDKKIKPDENSQRFYIEYLTLNPDNVEKICFGPKADGIKQYRELLVYHGCETIECSPSISPLA